MTTKSGLLPIEVKGLERNAENAKYFGGRFMREETRQDIAKNETIREYQPCSPAKAIEGFNSVLLCFENIN